MGGTAVSKRPAMQSVSKVVLCVHPFYRSGRGFSHDPNPMIKDGSAVEFMRKFWEGEMERHVKEEPESFMIFVGANTEPGYMEAHERGLLRKAQEIFNGRLEFLGIRMAGDSRFQALKSWLHPLISRKATGTAFGEYTTVCVVREAEFMQWELEIPVMIDRYASVDVEYAGDRHSVLEQEANGGVAERTGTHPYGLILDQQRRHVPVIDFLNLEAYRQSTG